MGDQKKHPTLNLTRFCDSEMGTFGELEMPNGLVLYTVERQWLDNKRNISCIPTGTYVCVRRKYHRGGYLTFEVRDVVNRSHILIHVANTHTDVQGCIGVGFSLGTLKDLWAIKDSKNAHDAFMECLIGIDSFDLVITHDGN